MNARIDSQGHTNEEPTSVFLTGGTGFVGRHLRDIFIREGINVTLLVQPDSAVSLRENESVVCGNITNQESFSIDDHDTVVHLAAQTSVDSAINSPRSTWDVNATGTLNILENIRNSDIDRFLFVSTASVYGEPVKLPISEAHPLDPVEPYGASKLAGDRLVSAYHHTYDVPAVIVRLFNTFGPGQPSHNVIPAIIDQAMKYDRVELGNLSPSRDFLYVKDTTEALFTLLKDGDTGEVYNLGSGNEIQIGELAQKIIQIIDENIELISTLDRQRNKGAEISRHVSDPSKLMELGWSPKYDLKQALEETINQFSTEE